VYAAWEVMGDLAASLGKFDAAASAYGKLVNAKLPATRARGFLLQGYALLHKGGTTEALSRFEEVARLEGDRTQALGAIGAAVCQARGGNADQAVEQIQKIIAENDASDVELFAKAYNALGECYELAEKNEDAILAFLHTDLLFYRDYDAHAQALFHLSKLWAEVNKPTDASKARQLLKDRYAATSWAKRQ
jgi:tetratricopeptide (TPR) repeat protein